MRATSVGWRPAPEERPLTPADLHVWAVPLTTGAEALERLQSLLSDDELERAGRFRRPHLGPRFIAARGRQREILASYLGVEPGDLRFDYGRLGRPALAAPFDVSQLCFNFSHCDDLALLAVARDREVGVDLERIRPLDEIEGVARRTFAPEERDALAQLPPAERLAGFYRCWTRKEAILKALGTGLSGEPGRFVVSLATDEPARVISSDGDARACQEWSLHGLVPAEGFVAAVAVSGAAPRLEAWGFGCTTEPGSSAAP